jgi:hypothetical protein
LEPTGNPEDWVIIRVYYPIPNSIEVLVKNTTGKDILVKPFPIRQGVAEDLRQHTEFCGANNFYYENGTIEFLVNGANKCQVRVRLSSFIKLSARLDIPFNDFYTSNGITTFIDNICAFLGIDTGRLKIVSVREGSTVIESVIQTTASDVDLAVNTTRNTHADHLELNRLAELLNSGIQNGSLKLGSSVLEFSGQVITFNEDGSVFTPASKNSDKALIISLSVILPILLVLAVFAGYCYWRRKRAQIHELDIVQNKSSAER